MVTRRKIGLFGLVLGLAVLPAASARTAAYPVTIHAANGTVTLAQKPVRIVSLSPTATEDLFAIGAGPQVVAVDDQSDYPARAPKTKLSGYTPNVEAIAGYQPDLVVTSYDTGGLVKSLEQLKIPVLLEPAAANLAGAYAQIRQLGAATGHEAAAARLVAGLRGQMSSIVGSLPAGAKGLTVYHELEPGLLLGHVDDVHRPDLQAARAEGHRRRGDRARARATRSCRRSTSSPRAPT